MPGRRRRNRRRRPRRRRRGGKSTRSMARFAYRAVRGAEVKSHNFSTVVSIDNSAAAGSEYLSGIGVGVGLQQRVGIKCRAIRLRLRFRFDQPEADFAYFNIRYMVVRQMAPVGAIPIGLGGVIENTTLDFSMVSPYNRTPGTPYKVLLDRKFVQSAVRGTQTNFRDHNINLGGLGLVYNTLAGTVFANAIKNALLLFVFSDNNAVADFPEVSVFSRLYFVDM